MLSPLLAAFRACDAEHADEPSFMLHGSCRETRNRDACVRIEVNDATFGRPFHKPAPGVHVEVLGTSDVWRGPRRWRECVALRAPAPEHSLIAAQGISDVREECIE